MIRPTLVHLLTILFVAAIAHADPTPATKPTVLQNLQSDVGNYVYTASPFIPPAPSDQAVYPDPLSQAAPQAPPNARVNATTKPTTLPSTLATSQSTQPTSESKNEWLVVPLPKYVPEFGWGITGMLGYIFALDPNDKISPPSTVGAFGYYAENGTWAAGLASKLYVDEDRYRITAALLHGDVRYSYFGTGTSAGQSGVSIPLNQQVNGGIFETLFQVTPGFYLGPKYLGANMHVQANTDEINSSINIPQSQINTTFSGLGIHAQWDTRDSQFYPRKGYLADVEAIFHDPAIGDDFSYQVINLAYNTYISLAQNQVLAFRAMGQFESGDVPFYALSQFGRGSDLRGYPIGQYQDKQMFAIQAEYRLEITKRFGAVAFFGVGEVAPTFYQFNFVNLLPAGGIGIRYVLAEKNHVAVRLDGAWGNDGFQYYFSIGEAF
jgi:hypothetical protein